MMEQRLEIRGWDLVKFFLQVFAGALALIALVLWSLS
jgi:hypothetical protein